MAWKMSRKWSSWENLWNGTLAISICSSLAPTHTTTPQSEHTHWEIKILHSVFSMINLTVSLWNLKGKKMEAFLFPVESNHSFISLGVYIESCLFRILADKNTAHNLLYIPFPFCLFFGGNYVYFMITKQLYIKNTFRMQRLSQVMHFPWVAIGLSVPRGTDCIQMNW